MDTKIIKDYLRSAYPRMLSEPKGDFGFPAFLPVAAYRAQLWDWGSYFSDVAIRQIASDNGKEDEISRYEKGCVLNFLDYQNADGSIPIVISSDPSRDINLMYPHKNIHKPVLAQHTAFIIKNTGDAEWIRKDVNKIESFISFYENNAKHESGLFYFFDDFAIGVDNDPCTFYRPDNSSASIYLNTFMYKELDAMRYIYEKLGNAKKALEFAAKRDELKEAINTLCYDEKDGFYYSCDINLRPIDKSVKLHCGAPRRYSALIQRIGVWSGFMPLWAGLADDDQAKRIIEENMLDQNAFMSNFGIRTLSKYEKMYRIAPSFNPSNWHGTIWIISNYMAFKGLLRYGYDTEAEKLYEKTLKLLSDDLAENGAFHEYYHPDTGKSIIPDKDFLSWNMLIENMIAHYENRKVIEEF